MGGGGGRTGPLFEFQEKQEEQIRPREEVSGTLWFWWKHGGTASPDHNGRPLPTLEVFLPLRAGHGV